MSKTQIIILVIAVIIVLGVIVFPLINKWQFKKMPFDQQIRILMKQANKLIYWKNISEGKKGTLIYIKNKRKILAYPWVLLDGKMLCTRKNPYDHWDYPEDQPAFTEDEIKQAKEELEKYNKKSAVKLYLQNTDD
ncbi:MAG: hypothetical protein ACLUFN_09330 [Eubacterium sp.]